MLIVGTLVLVSFALRCDSLTRRIVLERTRALGIIRALKKWLNNIRLDFTSILTAMKQMQHSRRNHSSNIDCKEKSTSDANMIVHVEDLIYKILVNLVFNSCTTCRINSAEGIYKSTQILSLIYSYQASPRIRAFSSDRLLSLTSDVGSW